MSPANLDPLLWNAREASERLGKIVSAYWLERQAAARAIPCTYLGKKLGFSEADLAELLEQRRNNPATRGRTAR